MIKSNKEFESNMRRLLIVIKDFGFPSCLSQDDLHCVEKCIADGYLTGAHTQRMASGKIVADISEIVRVEKAGLEFLKPKRDWKFIITAGIAVISVACNIIQMLISSNTPLSP